MSRWLGAIGAALADAVTAGLFVFVWLHPLALGPIAVKTAMLTMLVEFLLIHATGFLTVVIHGENVRPLQRIAAVGGLSLFYLLFVGAFAWSFGEWWPLLAFLWLVVGKVLWARRTGPDGDEATKALMAAWAGSVVAYLFACFATVVPPVPHLGMLAELRPQYGFDPDMGGLWIEEPHRVVAMGVLYFSLLALGKGFAAWHRPRS
jgi:hypothetical protein